MKDIDFEKIGKKLRETRISKGLTQEYIAEKADVNTSHISNIENNRVKISLQTLVNVCNTMDVTVDYILADQYTATSRTPDALDHELLHQLHSCSPHTKECVLDLIKVLQKHF
jgi:transcriptional regulator with XRE-family HTH domain